jgi:hypothetical protein
MATDMLTVAVLEDGEYTPAFPAFDVGGRGAQVALFIPR